MTMTTKMPLTYGATNTPQREYPASSHPNSSLPQSWFYKINTKTPQPVLRTGQQSIKSESSQPLWCLSSSCVLHSTLYPGNYNDNKLRLCWPQHPQTATTMKTYDNRSITNNKPVMNFCLTRPSTNNNPARHIPNNPICPARSNQGWWPPSSSAQQLLQNNQHTDRDEDNYHQLCRLINCTKTVPHTDMDKSKGITIITTATGDKTADCASLNNEGHDKNNNKTNSRN